MKFKNFKRLASTHLKKSILLLVISSMSALMLCSCGDDSSAQLETSVETDVTEETQETTETLAEITEETQEITEATTEAEETEETPESISEVEEVQATPQPTETSHVHTWTTETYYTTESNVVHHDAVTHVEEVTTYTTETQTIHHDEVSHVEYYDRCWCNDCGYYTESWQEMNEHNEQNFHWRGYTGDTDARTVVDSPAWDEVVEVQVPHTELVTVVDSPAWDETVETQVPHTREICSECGAKK